ncbi:MAG: hypothetical protein ACOX3K_00755 [Bacilli bacterium]|jgi:hypothetical protein
MKNHKKRSLLIASIGLFALCISASVVSKISSDNHFLNADASGCTHSVVNHYEAVVPGELTAGHIEYWCCCECHKSFSDAACTMLIADTQTAGPLTKGDGRYIAPTLASIDSADEFVRLMQLFKAHPKATPFTGEFKLSTDINLSGKVINGDGPNSAKILFNGTGNYARWGATFDGDGHSITGFNFAAAFTGFGMFGSIHSTGVVRNLVIKDMNFGWAGVNCYGSIFAWNNAGTIENCCVRGKILNKGVGNNIGNSLFASQNEAGGTIVNSLGIDTSDTGPFTNVGVLAGNCATSAAQLVNSTAISTKNPKVSNIAAAAGTAVAADATAVDTWYAGLSPEEKAALPLLSESGGLIYWGTMQIGTVI